MKTITVTRAAANKVGMTIADMAAFLADSQDHNVPTAIRGHCVIKVRTTWRGTIRSAQITFDDEN